MSREISERRMVADRFRRIWAIVQEIADHPGHGRLELARLYNLSERQVQSDLNIIRLDMGLPLVRRQGYRFVAEGGVPTAAAIGITVHDAQFLVLLVQQARRLPLVAKERAESLAQKLPLLFPPHLTPLMARLMDAGARPGRDQQVFAALTDAALAGTAARLHYPRGKGPHSGIDEPVVWPELLLPYLRNWYVLARCEGAVASRMFNLADVMAVTSAAGRAL